MDKTLFDESTEQPMPARYMKDKEVLYVQDQNGGSYNGQITLDTSILANSGKWCDYSSAHLEIPFKIVLRSDQDVKGAPPAPIDLAGIVNSFSLGLKNGHYQLIDSIQVDYNNSNVVQLQPYTNFYVNYKVLSSWSQDDLNKHGDTCGVAPDTPDSFTRSAGAGRDGDGICNNRPTPVVADFPWGAAQGPKDRGNTGFYQRLSNSATAGTAFNEFTLGGVHTMGNTNALISNKLDATNTTKFSDNAAAAGARVWQWDITATIRLKDVADFFDKVPLVKGAFFRFTINYNSIDATFTSAAAAAVTLLQASLTQKSGRTNPVMLSSGDAAEPNQLLLDGTHNIWSGIGTLNPQVGSSPLTSVRLYVPCYELDEMKEKELLSVGQRRVRYEDIYNFNISGIGSVGADGTGGGSSFNQILTNGIANPKCLVVIPQINGAANNNATATLIPYQSLFDSAPGTTCPYASITNFNVQVSGKNVFQQDFNYDFEAFQNELQSLNALNGGVTTSLTSGLISKRMFQSGYRYYVADLSRGPLSDRDIPKSVVVKGTNNTGVAMDYICFIVFEREVIIDMVSGGLVKP
jgi:hypothetical protein